MGKVSIALRKRFNHIKDEKIIDINVSESIRNEDPPSKLRGIFVWKG